MNLSTRIKLFLLLCGFALPWGPAASGQLALGDMAFVEYQSDNPDIFSVVVLNDVPMGTQFTVTDYGWFAAGGFRDTEGYWTFETSMVLGCGQVLWYDDANDELRIGTDVTAATIIDGSGPALAASGDQLFLFDGDISNQPVDNTTAELDKFVAAIQMNGAWDADAISSNTSAQPMVFTDGVNSISIDPEVDNAQYTNGGFTGTADEIRTAVSTSTNWFTDDAILASLVGPTLSFTCQAAMPTCDADAGTLTATSDNCLDGTADLSAAEDTAPTVPAGFEVIYVLTSGTGLVIENVNTTPDFTVSAAGLYTIHTLVYDPLTLDLGIVEFGVTTGLTVNGLLIQGGGSICASLDVPGASFQVLDCCTADAGTLTATSDNCLDGTADLSAAEDTAPTVPAGFQVIYVLTSGTDLVIENVNTTPDFTVSAEGLYTIHTLVYDPVTLDLGIVEFGVTTGLVVNGLLQQGGGSICASLDVPGASFQVEDCCTADAGTLTATSDNCLDDTADLSAAEDTAPTVPAGFQVIYVLTSGTDLVIENVNTTPDFTVSAEGLYTIHTLVYDPVTLDLGIVEFGVTTGLVVNGLLQQGGGAICASLDVPGASFQVEDCCQADAGSVVPGVNAPQNLCDESGDAISFTADYSNPDNNDPNAGFSVLVPQITEIRIDQSGADDDEFFEIFGTPGTDLSNYTYLVIGDGTGGSGVIENVTPLTGQVIPASGYFVAAMSTFTLGTADFTTDLNFENGDNVTHVLVEGFTGMNGDDLDTDDDGTPDVAPWTSVVDAIGLVETIGTGDLNYGAALGFVDVGPDGIFVPVSVAFDGTMWNIIPFSNLGDNTPGSGALVAPSLEYSYFYVVTDGTPDFNIITLIQGSQTAPYAADLSEELLDPGTYCVHGFSFLGTIDDLLAYVTTNNVTTGVEVATAIANGDICGDLIVADCTPLTVLDAIVADAGEPQVVCADETVNLSAASGPNSGMWSGGAGVFADASSNTTTYTPDPSEAGTTFTLTWTTTDGSGLCGDLADEVIVTVIPQADAEFSYDAELYCPNGMDPILTQTTGTPGIFSYTVVSGGPILNLDPETGAISLAGSDQGTYTITNDVSGCGNMIISGVIDGPITGGVPKAIEFYVVEDIPDLSDYGFGSANNGGGTDGQEFTFPAESASAGDYLYVATESLQFTNFFGFAPTYLDMNFAASVNGDDAIELFCRGQLIDYFGDRDVDGTGQPWEYLDGWAYRTSDTGPDGGFFNLENWFFSGPNALDGFMTNDEAGDDAFPIGTFTTGGSGICPDASASFTLTIDDTEDPVLSCPADIIVNLGPGECGAFVDFEITATDNCDPNPVITKIDGNPDAGDFFEYGVYILEYSATDIFGNTGSCTFTVTVNEFPDPVATLVCNDDVNISIDASGMATIGADMILEGGPYGCYDDYIVEILDNFGNSLGNVADCSMIGTTWTVRVTDPETGNMCWGELTLEDKLAPVFDCPADPIVISCVSDPDFVAPPVATDNCTSVQYNLIDQVYMDEDECDDNLVKLAKVWVAIDEYGNISEECIQEIHIERPSDVDFPNDVQYTCEQFDANPSIVDATLFGAGVPPNIVGDYCGYAYTHNDEMVETCGETFKIVRTWTVLDWCTNTVISSNQLGEDNVQVITIVDNTPPTITMMPFEVSANVPGAHPQPCTSQDILPAANISDNCSDWTVRIFTPIGEADYLNGTDGSAGGVIPAPGLQLGIYQILYQAEDVCGNIAELFVTIEVVDDIAPVTICDEITEAALSSDGLAVVPASTFDDGSYDNCCLDEFLVRRMDGDCDGNFDHFGPDVTFCCEDVANSPIMVVFRAVDCYGNFNDCMVEVYVEDKLPPTGTCPPDATITCEDYLENYEQALGAGDDSVLEVFGMPSFFDNCEPIITYEWDFDVNTCQEGQITRTWTVEDPSGNTPFECTQTIFVEHVSDWVVEFPEDMDATCEDGELPDFGEPEIFFDECELIGTAFEDVFFFIVPDACYKVVRTWTVINWCIFEEFGEDVYPEAGFSEADLFVDWDGDFDFDERTFRDGWNTSGTPGIADGYITYEQTIKVIDNDDPIFDVEDLDVCIEGSTCDTTVELPVPDVDDCSNTATIVVTSDLPGATGDQYVYENVPPGVYSVLYTVTDECGNTSFDNITVTVEDCKKPTPYCVNGLVIEIMQTGMIDIWANDFDAGSFDNCPGDLKLSFSPDVNDDSIIFDCDDLGQQLIQLWVTDAAGNQDFCETFVIVQDNMGACTSTLAVSGAIETENGLGVDNTMVEINGGAFSGTTDNNGFYNIGVTAGGDYSVIANNDMVVNQGVTTYDIVLVTQHILGINPLDSPYKLIAADANNSQTVTTLDVVEIRKVILQIQDYFTNNTSWRFVDAAYDFPQPTFPWSEAFPEFINYNNINSDITDANFIGIKVGDVNNSIIPNAMIQPENRTNGSFFIEANDRSVAAGETFQVDFRASDAVAGYQFTLNFDPAVLEMVELVEGVATNENFGLTRLDDGAITTSWNATDIQSLDDVLFSIIFTSESEAQLSELISINSRFTTAEAYGTQGNLEVELAFNGLVASKYELYQNVPNPATGQTLIGFNMAEAGNATLRVVDLSGKVLRIIDGNFNAGYNAFELDARNLGVEGVVYYTLETAAFTATKKMVVLR